MFAFSLHSFADAEELSSRLMHTIIDIRNDEDGRVVLEEARKEKIENPLNLHCIYFEELLSEFSIYFVFINNKKLMTIHCERNNILSSLADNQNNAKAIVSRPLIKNSGSKLETNALQKVENDTIPKERDRGNCYTEPIQTRDNCVTSELYLIT